MQTKKEMIEAIREKVVMANNPECKTYHEALEMETFGKNGGHCMALIIKPSRFEAHKIEQYHEVKNIYKKDMIKILGLPLTLERILVALKIANEKRLKNDIEFLEEVRKDRDLNSISEIEDWMFFDTYHSFPFISFETAFSSWIIATGADQGIIDWQPNATLEHQSENTIKEIYEILCSTK